MCIAIVSGVLLNRAERLFCDAVCFDPINHKNMVAPRSKTNKREERKKDPFACIESPQSLTVQFQRREYFMKMKHSEMTGIIKAYKSLKWLRLLFFILQVQTCTHASTINCYSHRLYYTHPSKTITWAFKTHKKYYNCATGTLSPLRSVFLSLLVSSKPTLRPMGLTKQKTKLSAPLNSVHPNHPLRNREGTTGLPSATNLGQTKAKSARISHYTCFPSSLSPERTREWRGISRFPSIETVELQTTQGSHFAPHSHCRSERCERRDEAWWRIRRGASYWRPLHKWK